MLVAPRSGRALIRFLFRLTWVRSARTLARISAANAADRCRTRCRLLFGRAHEGFQNRAGTQAVAGAAASQFGQRFLQIEQADDALADQADVGVEQLTDPGAGLCGRGGELEQPTDFGKGNIERATVANEVQSRKMLLESTRVS